MESQRLCRGSLSKAIRSSVESSQTQVAVGGSTNPVRADLAAKNIVHSDATHLESVCVDLRRIEGEKG